MRVEILGDERRRRWSDEGKVEALRVWAEAQLTRIWSEPLGLDHGTGKN